jgi:hypothetical protein
MDRSARDALDGGRTDVRAPGHVCAPWEWKPPSGNLGTDKAQGGVVISRERLTASGRERKHSVIDGVVRLDGKPGVRLFVEGPVVLRLSNYATKVAPRLPEAALEPSGLAMI